MTIVGMNMTTTSEGMVSTTLHVTDEFNTYYHNPSAGRSCIGEKCESIYVGNHDCSELRVGMVIDILYDKAITTNRGTFQPIKRIEIISE